MRMCFALALMYFCVGCIQQPEQPVGQPTKPNGDSTPIVVQPPVSSGSNAAANEAFLFSQLVTAHNTQRSQQRVEPLALNQRLNVAATGHAKWMAANRKMSHPGANGSSPSQRIDATGYQWRTAGENIAAGYATVPSVMNGWMNSPGHRANILSENYTEVGFGSAKDVSGKVYWAAVFAAPMRPGALQMRVEEINAPEGLEGGE